MEQLRIQVVTLLPSRRAVRFTINAFRVTFTALKDLLPKNEAGDGPGHFMRWQEGGQRKGHLEKELSHAHCKRWK